MTSREIWVHGTSGHIQVVRDDWGWAKPMGWGLHMEIKVDDFNPDRMPWVQFHIPLPAVRPEAADAPRLKKVMLKFATDREAPGWFVKYPGTTSQMWRRDQGGAMVHKLHVWDSDALVKKFEDMNWQSDNLDTYSVEFKDLPEEPVIHWGLGISVQLWFKNQLIVGEKITGPGGERVPDWWRGEAFHDDDTPWTESKRAVISSVGCVYEAKP